MNVLLTGASGVLGAELLRSLSQARPGARIHVLLRAANADELRTRATTLGASLGAAAAVTIVPLAGDVTAPRLGLGCAFDDLAGSVDEIYHAAASTRFDMTREFAYAHNVVGTRHVLELAHASQRTSKRVRMHYVSTAYVSGSRAGCVTEDELDCGQDFFNAYEWSKFEAEREVRAASASTDLPVTIYRPGVVVGNSRTGHARRFAGVYQVLRWLASGQVRALPCRDDFHLDLAPGDYVADAIVRLASLPDSVGHTFHLTAGPGNTLSVKELISILFAERDAAGTPERQALPSFESEAEPRDRRLDPFVPYLTCPKTFDVGNVRAFLRGLDVPLCRSFFPRVVRYALDTGFRA